MRLLAPILVAAATALAVVAVIRVRAPERAAVSAPPEADARLPKMGADGRTEEEREAIAAAETAERRAASAADAERSPELEDYEKLYTDYEPFFVRGDLDGDGRLDFAQAFVSRRDPLRFDVAVFFSASPGRFRSPIFVETGVELAAGDLAIDRSLLLVTPDLSAELSRRYRFDEAARRFVDVDAASPDASEEEPDGKPRLRT